MRDLLKAVGGKYSGSTRTWTLTDEQYALALARVEASARRSNKRDTQLSCDWSSVRVIEVES